MTSHTPADIAVKNQADGQTKTPYMDGHKMGRVRLEFNANSGKEIGTHTLGFKLPAGCHVTRAFYLVKKTFTSATDAATIALTTGVSANDLVSAVAISNGGNPWDAGGLVPSLIDDALDDDIAVTAAVEPAVVVASEALTAGKLLLWIEYAYRGDMAADG